MGAPLYAELRYWPELAGLLTQGRFRSPARAAHAAPVLLIPGFMAGDASLTLLAGWLRRRGHTVRLSGIRVNAGCAGRELTRLEQVLGAFDRPAIVIGQSRGGTLARALAARRPEAVAAVVMLGSPVLDPLAVSPRVMRTVRSVARLGDLGVPGVFSSECRAGDCCTNYYALLRAPLTESMVALMVYSRTDAIVDWHACLDPSATCVEISGSHCGMAVNARVYEELERVLESAEAPQPPRPTRSGRSRSRA
ncbi:MAG: esterase/lipase family protein [Solirubrobacteraceae bacterium]